MRFLPAVALPSLLVFTAVACTSPPPALYGPKIDGVVVDSSHGVPRTSGIVVSYHLGEFDSHDARHYHVLIPTDPAGHALAPFGYDGTSRDRATIGASVESKQIDAINRFQPTAEQFKQGESMIHAANFVPGGAPAPGSRLWPARKHIVIWTYWPTSVQLLHAATQPTSRPSRWQSWPSEIPPDVDVLLLPPQIKQPAADHRTDELADIVTAPMRIVAACVLIPIVIIAWRLGE